MSNMGYCRFQNTLRDLNDCTYHFIDDNLSNEEENARKLLIELCKSIVLEFEDYDEI